MNEMSIDLKTAEDIGRAIRSLGDDAKKQYDELDKSLAKLREADSETKKYADALVTEQVEKMRADFDLRRAALEETLKSSTAGVEARFDERLAAEVAKIEVVLRRGGTGFDADPEKARAEIADAVELKRTQLVRAGKMDQAESLDPAAVDMDAYRAYRKASVSYCRRHLEGISADERKALTLGVDPSGGYLVTPVVSGRIIQKIYETSPVRQLASVQQIGTDKLVFVVDYDEAGCGWVGEVQARPETTTPTFASIEIEAREQYAKPKVSQVLLEDSSIDLEAYLAAKVADKMGRVEATAFISGTGVMSPRGLLTYNSGVGYDKIEQIATGNATLLTADSLVALPWALKDAYRGNAQWLLRRSAMPKIVTFKDGQGQYLYGLALRGKTLGDSISGYPLNLGDDMPDVAAGSLSVLFGDFRTAYQIVDRLGLTMLRDPYSDKPHITFYMRRRVGAGLVQGEALKILLTSA